MSVKTTYQNEFSVEAVVRLAKLYGLLRAKSIIENLKTPGMKYYLRVNTLRSTSEEVVHLLREENVEAYKLNRLSDVIYLLVKGPYILAKLDKFVVAKKEAAEAVYMGANLYGPGVISAKRVLEGDYVNVVNPHGYVVAEGIAIMDGDEMVARRKGLAVKVIRSTYKVPSVRELEVYREGFIYDQCLPSIIAGHVLNPKPGWLVVDMCAAPGGKATHAAQLMEGEGVVIAIDRSENKCRRIIENAQRLGLKNINVRISDSRYLDLVIEDLRGS
ncbi:MAG: PUA domain-containing protein, partial [Thermofilaceae archaeon]